MNRLRVDAFLVEGVQVLDVAVKADRTGKPTLDAAGRSRSKISVLGGEAGRPAVVAVSMPSDACEAIAVGDRVTFGGLVVGLFAPRSGGEPLLYVTAESVLPVGRGK